MGKLYSKSSKDLGTTVMLPINRVSRYEQYDWFITFRDGSDEDIIQIVKTSPHMMTTVMYFDILEENQQTCDCTYLFEKCVLSDDKKTKSNILFRLDRSIYLGTCPHIYFRQTGGKNLNDVLELSDEQLTILMENEKCVANMRNANYSTLGIYGIHLAVLFERTTLMKKIIPVLRGFHFPFFVLQTRPSWCVPFYLSALAEDEELTQLLCKLHTFPKMPSRSCPLAPKSMLIAERLASRGTVKALQVFFSVKETRTNENFQQAFRGALTSKSKPLLDYLSQIGATPNSKTALTEVERGINQSDLFTVVYLLRCCEVTITEHMLLAAIQEDNKSMVRVLLQKLEASSLPYTKWSRCLVEAVLRKSLNIVKQLVVVKFDLNACFGGISVLKWAEVLKYGEIQQILTEAGGRSFQEYENTSPYNSVLHLRTDLSVPLLKLLIKNGYDVNNDADGTPAFFTAMLKSQFHIMYLLLINGANPYLKPDIWKYYLIRQDNKRRHKLILTFVQANFALSAETKMTIIGHICNEQTPGKQISDSVRIILECAHSLTRNDRDELLQYSKTQNGKNVGFDIEDYLFVPKSLQVCCRNSLRQKYNHNFHKLMERIMTDLPQKIINFLQCNDILNEYYSEGDQLANKNV